MKTICILLQILLIFELCYTDEFKLKDFKTDKENVLNFSKRKVFSIESKGYLTESEGYKKIKETGDLILDNHDSQIYISTGEYFVFEKESFLKIDSIKNINFIKISSMLNMSSMINKVIIIKNIEGGFTFCFFKEQNNEYLTIEAINLKGDWFESIPQLENFKKLLIENKFVSLEEQNAKEIAKENELKVENAKLIFGTTSINNCLGNEPTGIKFEKGENFIFLPIIDSRTEKTKYYADIIPLSDMLFSFQKEATLNILPMGKENSVLLDDFLLRKIFIDGINSSDLPWQYGIYKFALDKFVGQSILIKLESNSLAVIKILEATEKSIKFKWVIRKDGILDFSNLKAEPFWSDIITTLEKSKKIKLGFDDFVKSFVFFKTIVEKEKVVKSAIKDGFNINEKNKRGDTPLIYFATIGVSSNDLEILLKNGADPNIFSNFGWTALHSSATQCLYENCKILIDYGASINSATIKEKLTPLQLALARNCKPDLITLLSKKEDFNIFEIISTNNIEKLYKYIKDKKDLNILNNEKKSPLFLAVESKNTKTIQIILENIEINWSKTSDKNNPFLEACAKNEKEILDLFFNYGKLNQQILNEGLFVSCISNNFEICELLIGKGAKLDAKIKSKSSAEIIMERGDFKMISLLNKHGVALEFWAVCRIGDNELAKQLLLTKNLVLINKSGRSALHFAVISNNIELVELLLKSKLLLNEKDESDNDKSALIHASELGFFEIVKTLIEAKCDINQFSIAKRGALFYAVNNNHLEIVKYLLEKGANPNLNNKNENGENPLLEKSLKLNKEIYNTLIKFGAK